MAYEAVLTALADPTRRDILERLARGPSTVGALAEVLPVSRPAVSQHLRVLELAGLVRPRAQGTRRIYSVDPGGLEDLRRYLERFWGDVLAAFQRAADAEAERNAAAGRRQPAGRGREAVRRAARRPPRLRRCPNPSPRRRPRRPKPGG